MLLMKIDVDGILRSIWAALCQIIYRLIAFLYELFMNIASVKLLAQDDIKPIYQRVTMILAIIMVFYVTLEVVKYVVDPDKMTDKEKGASNLVKHMIIVVVLIAFVPMIFEKAYDLQNSLIKNQVFSKIILGRVNNDMSKVGREFSAQMFSLFYYYDDEYWSAQSKQPKDNACDGANCKTIAEMNVSTLATDGNLRYINMGLNETTKVTMPSGKDQEVKNITFDGLLAVVVGAFIVYVLVLYCIDTGVRVVQLLFLQVIAPIPIIGYLAPKKEGIFQKWVKQCITTYLDLFIRITIICFVLLIVEILGNAYHEGTLFNNIGEVSRFMKVLMYVAIVMGLLLFAQKAPKMLQELFPKMGAASGNFGLKAGERVAPAAARTIGASLGATRMVGGAIARGVNTARRNKEERDRTGMTRKQQKEQIKQDKRDMRTARNDYKQALRTRNSASRAYNRLTGKGKEDYDAAQEKFQQKKDRFIETKSQYADDQNKRYRSVAANALAGAAGGAYRGAKAGAGATKLEDIGKKVKEGYSNDKKAIDAREEWLNSGGYSNVQRTISGIEQGIGVTTAAGLAQREISRIDSSIKSNETLIARESDVKSKEDGAKDRSGSKIDSGEQKTVIKAGQTFTIKDLKGEKHEITVSEDGTTSSVYAEYKNKAESARAKADAATQSYQNLQAAKLRESGKGTWTADDDAALEKAKAESEQAEHDAMIAADEQGKVRKAMQEYAITDILQNPNATYQDGVLREKVSDTLASIAETTRDERTREKMREALKEPVPETDDSGHEIKDADGNTVYKRDSAGNIVYNYDKYDNYISGKITTYDQMDDIQTALINIANERTRENVELKGTKARMEASDAYAAQKADDKASGGGKK